MPMKNPVLFRQKLAEATQLTNSIESTFNQEKSLSVLSEKIVTKGKFYFRKNNMLRWEYTEPFNYLIILNNGKILVRDEEKENQFDSRANKVFGEINSILLGCAQGTLLNDEKKFQSSYYETPNYYLVRMKPKDPRLKEIFNEICIYFDKVDFSVSRLIMNEVSGDFTTIKFSAKKLNVNIPDEKFQIH
jgi:outer membrane lipoprotein-sorting protein